MEKDFVYIFQVWSRGSWRDKYSGKDLESLSELAKEWSRISLEKSRVIRLDFETITFYGDDE